MTAVLLAAALVPPPEPDPEWERPRAFVSRTGASKSKALGESGGTRESELRVVSSAKWLAQQQKNGGFWEFDGGTLAAREADRATATGLVLLPFVGAGVTQWSMGSKYQKTVADGLTYLRNDLDLATGKFRHVAAPYTTGHAVATLALCEAYALTGDRAFEQAAQAAVNFIGKTQAADGGWGDPPGAASDINVFGWQLQALRAARLSRGLVVPDVTFEKAAAFLNRVGAGALKSQYGTTSPADAKPGTTPTAIGLWARAQLDGWGPNNPGLTDGVQGLFGRPKAGAAGTASGTGRALAPRTTEQAKADGATPDVLHYYHATRAVHEYGGELWYEWYTGTRGADGAPRVGGMQEWLIHTQRGTGNDAGSWDADAGPIGRAYGRLGTTAFAALILETPYRYQRAAR